ncbi:MAG: hypothetical protein ACPGN3_02150 [Opitutales bacterium]
MSTKQSLDETWEEVRKSVSVGPCADLSIRDLALSIGYKPIFSVKDKKEYLASDFAYMGYEELCEHPDFKDDPEKVQRLIRLFRETAGYDMSLEGISSKVGRNDSAAQTILNQLKVSDIPQDFPPNLMTISSTLKTLVDAEGVTNLRNFFEVSARFTKVLGKNQELADIERAFLSASPSRVGKFLPLNPNGKGTSLQTLMRGFFEFRAPSYAPLESIALGLGFDSSIPSDTEPASQKVLQEFINEMLEYYERAAKYFPEGDADLYSAVHDFTVFERSTRHIEEPTSSYILFKIVRMKHGEEPSELSEESDDKSTSKEATGSTEKEGGFFKKVFGFFSGK